MYPKQVRLFVPWSKAMVAGATVDKPNYSKKKKSTLMRRKRRATARRRRKNKDG